MAKYCSVCGRELKKSEGPIGPKCLQKMRPKNLRTRRISREKYAAVWEQYDLFGGEDGQTEDGTASESTEGQENVSNAKGRKAAKTESRGRGRKV